MSFFPFSFTKSELGGQEGGIGPAHLVVVEGDV
jgi:hypothetical protein